MMTNNDIRTRLIKLMLTYNVQLDPRIFDILDLNKSQDELMMFLLNIVGRFKAKGKFFNIITLDMVKEELDKSEPDEEVITFKFTKLKDFSTAFERRDVQATYNEMLKDRVKKAINVFKSRSDFKDVISIVNAKNVHETKNILRICGLVLERQFRRSEVVLTVEDLSDRVEIHVPYDVYYRSGEVLLDECIFIELQKDNDLFVCNKFYHLDIGDLIKNNCTDNLFIAFLSDLCIGQEEFDSDSWKRFVAWLNGNFGDKKIIDNIKVLVIVGDLIDVSNSSNLQMKNAYENVVRLLQQIPSKIKVVIVPGERDTSSYFLPQIPIIRSFAKSLYSLNNVEVETNPFYFSVNEVRILAFHGQSLDDIREQIKYNDSVTRLMMMLLKARHVAPSLGRLYRLFPSEKDVLFIDEVPNIFVCGHLSEKGVSYYKGVLLLSLPSWGKKNDAFGGRCAIVNLRSLEVLWR